MAMTQTQVFGVAVEVPQGMFSDLPGDRLEWIISIDARLASGQLVIEPWEAQLRAAFLGMIGELKTRRTGT